MTGSPPDAHPPLSRVLGVRDLVLLNVAAIVSLRWLTSAAQLGPSSLVLWSIGLLVFLVPLALAVLELSSRLPGEGGFYLWSKAAFGDAPAFLSGWSYWVSNLVYFPTLLLFTAGLFAHAGGDTWAGLAEHAGFHWLWSLGVLWGATLLALHGLRHARWLQNLGAIATWGAVTCVCGGAALLFARHGSATPITTASLRPELSSTGGVSVLAHMAFAYVGFELGPVLGGEIREPRRSIPIAIGIASVAIAATYIAGTLALLITLPPEQIDLIGGIAQAMGAVGERLGQSWFGPVASLLVTFGAVGGLSAWINGTARLPFVFGLDRHLPASLARVHAPTGTPRTALLMQSIVATLVLGCALAGTSIREAYHVLLDMTGILTFLPILGIFVALPVLRRRAAGQHNGVRLVPGGTLGLWLVTMSGAGTTLGAIAIRRRQHRHDDRALFLAKVGGGCLLLLGIGALCYVRGGGRRGAENTP